MSIVVDVTFWTTRMFYVLTPCFRVSLGTKKQSKMKKLLPVKL